MKPDNLNNIYSLYRRFRPAKFEEVIGQSAIVTSLQNQLKSGTVGHAYIFSGTRGTGKTSVAKIFARALNCLDPDDSIKPCNKCENCLSNSLDVYEIDGASNNSVDNIRELIESVKFAPVAQKKVYIIDEAHMITTNAFNALLKTLEEPPEYVVFIFATTELHKIPPTIQSRCQKYEFKRVTHKALYKRMSDILEILHVKFEPSALDIIISYSDGAVRDSLSKLEQCLSGATTAGFLKATDVVDILGIPNDSLILKIILSAYLKEYKLAIQSLHTMLAQGKDILRVVRGFIDVFRDLMLYGAAKEYVSGTDEYLRLLELSVGTVDSLSIDKGIDIFIELSKMIKVIDNKVALTEVSIIKLGNVLSKDSKLNKSILGKLGIDLKNLEEADQVVDSDKVTDSITDNDNITGANNTNKDQQDFEIFQDSADEYPFLSDEELSDELLLFNVEANLDEEFISVSEPMAKPETKSEPQIKATSRDIITDELSKKSVKIPKTLKTQKTDITRDETQTQITKNKSSKTATKVKKHTSGPDFIWGTVLENLEKDKEMGLMALLIGSDAVLLKDEVLHIIVPKLKSNTRALILDAKNITTIKKYIKDLTDLNLDIKMYEKSQADTLIQNIKHGLNQRYIMPSIKNELMTFFDSAESVDIN